MLTRQLTMIRAANKRLSGARSYFSNHAYVEDMPSSGSRVSVTAPENASRVRLVAGCKLREWRSGVGFVDAFVYAAVYAALKQLNVLNSRQKNRVFGSFMLIYGRLNHGS
jgi:hypothetical protein